MKLAVFFHTLLWHGCPAAPLFQAIDITRLQMEELHECGLLEACSDFIVGINGGEESEALRWATIPDKAKVVYHGLAIKSENLTIAEIEKWLPGHEDYYVLYFHAKGCTWPVGDEMRDRWRGCMMRNVVLNWRQCVKDLDSGYEAVGCHWMTPPKTPPTQFIFAGNFWWAKASFLKTLPSIYERARIKQDGIGALESRYESEVWIGNGPRPPVVRDYHPHWHPGKAMECQP